MDNIDFNIALDPELLRSESMKINPAISSLVHALLLLTDEDRDVNSACVHVLVESSACKSLARIISKTYAASHVINSQIVELFVREFEQRFQLPSGYVLPMQRCLLECESLEPISSMVSDPRTTVREQAFKLLRYACYDNEENKKYLRNKRLS